MRRKSLETFGGTIKQKSIENEEKQSTSKRRSTDSETLKFLQEKTKSEMAIRQQGIELRRKEIRNKQKCFIIKSNFDFNRKNNQFMLQMLQ